MAKTVVFPSADWFQTLADIMADQQAHFEGLGACDCIGQVTIWDAPDGEWRCQFVFEEFGVHTVREVSEDADADADWIMETDMETWQEMVESIVEGEGQPGLLHTLNRLSMPGTPIRMWSTDTLNRDTFFRFNQTIQHFFNNCGTFTTTWPEN